MAVTLGRELQRPECILDRSSSYIYRKKRQKAIRVSKLFIRFERSAFSRVPVNIDVIHWSL
jgi:hypothetical protein